MVEPRATYRLQLGRELGFAEAAGARPLPRRARRLAPLPLALAPGPARLHARLRRRRPDQRLRGSRWGGRASHVVVGGPRFWARARPRHRPQPHGRDGREPVLARPALAREVLRPRLAHRRPPSLLRRRRVGRCADGGPGGLGGDASEGDRAGPGRCGRRRPGRPSRRPGEPAPLPGAPARSRDRARLGGEDPRAGRAAAAGLARRGHDRLRVPQRRHRALRRPGRRGAADAALPRPDRRAPSLRRGRGRGEARAGVGDVRRGGRAARREAAVRGRRRARARLLPCLPHVRRARRGPRRRRRPGSRRGSRTPRGARPDPPARGAGARRFRRALPADDARPCTRRASRTRRSTAGTGSSR